jgi:hypothetical protein
MAAFHLFVSESGVGKKTFLGVFFSLQTWQAQGHPPRERKEKSMRQSLNPKIFAVVTALWAVTLFDRASV